MVKNGQRNRNNNHAQTTVPTGWNNQEEQVELVGLVRQMAS